MKRIRQAKQPSVEAITMATAMPLAALITLSHRLPMLAGAATGSNAWDDPEFRRMVEEKVHAATQGALAMGGAAAAGHQAVTDYAVAQAKANLALATSRQADPTAAFAFAEASFKRLSQLTETLGEIGSHSVAKGLRPTHRKVTANAKRLARRNQPTSGK